MPKVQNVIFTTCVQHVNIQRHFQTISDVKCVGSKNGWKTAKCCRFVRSRPEWEYSIPKAIKARYELVVCRLHSRHANNTCELLGPQLFTSGHPFPAHHVRVSQSGMKLLCRWAIETVESSSDYERHLIELELRWVYDLFRSIKRFFVMEDLYFFSKFARLCFQIDDSSVSLVQGRYQVMFKNSTRAFVFIHCVWLTACTYVPTVSQTSSVWFDHNLAFQLIWWY